MRKLYWLTMRAIALNRTPTLIIAIVCALLPGIYLLYLQHSHGHRLGLLDQSSEYTGAVRDTAGSSVTKVLLLTFMRGGSSLLGEMFNQNSEALYWFEPIDGFYSHMYGTTHGLRPLDIFYNQDETNREVPGLEKTVLIKGLQDMFSCNLHVLPVDVLTNSNLMNLVQKSFKPYTDCLITGKVKDNLTTFPRPQSSRGCKEIIHEFCPPGFNEHQFQTCKSTLFPFHERLRRGHPIGRVTTTYDRYTNGTNGIPTETLERYMECLNKSHYSSRPCLPLLEKSCHLARVRTLKVIRLRLSMVESIIEAIPDIKIVVEFRDPRGIVVSRRHTVLISRVAKNMENEAKLLCRRLRSELEILHVLKKAYPRNIMDFTYEDMATEPLTVLDDIYKFIGHSLPGDVRQWFSTHLNADRNDVEGFKEGAYTTSRKNATFTAFNWRNKLSIEAINITTSFCIDVLKVLGYKA